MAVLDRLGESHAVLENRARKGDPWRDSVDFYCPIIRGERRRLEIRMAAIRDLPKLSSSCTTVVIARGADS